MGYIRDTEANTRRAAQSAAESARSNASTAQSAAASARSGATTAHSAASSARSNATAARAAQSAATGVWVGAGLQAVTAMQSARAARAQEEQLALQHAMAQQEQLHQFAMWRQTPDGEAFVAWQPKAVGLSQAIRQREAEWHQRWAFCIDRAKSEVPSGEQRRYAQQPARMKQIPLRVCAIICYVLAGYLGFVFLSSLLWFVSIYAVFMYGFLFALPLVGGVALSIVRKKRIELARRDPQIAQEHAGRIARWGFDPLELQPGYVAFSWSSTSGVFEYADRLMQTAVTGHSQFPARSQLLHLIEPAVWPPHSKHPPEINDLLVRFQQESCGFS